MTGRRAALAATSVLVVLVLVVAIGIGGSGHRAAVRAHGSENGPAPLRPHPRVVIAMPPGEIPADAQFTYTDEEDQGRPPSDAEVKRELAELHVAKLGGSSDYVDPLAQVRGLKPERIDMGVDYAGTGPVVALGSGTVFNVKGAGWPGGMFIGITLDSGRFAGLSYYVAEDVRPAVRVGQHVLAGQEIAVMYRGGEGIETGWATGRGDEPLAATLGQQARNGDPGAWSSAAGISFDRVLVSAGTPSGIPHDKVVHGKMPPRYP